MSCRWCPEKSGYEYGIGKELPENRQSKDGSASAGPFLLPCYSSRVEDSMPLIPGQGHVGDNIREFRTGKTFAHTEAKFGKARAEKQALAVALHTEDETGDERDYLKPASIHGRK